MDKKTQIGECLNLFIPQDKVKEFWSIIEDAGFEKTGQGVIEFVMTEVDEDEPAENSSASIAVGALRDWAEKHPAEWSMAKKKGSAVMRSLLGKLRF